jgi:hypothetical protein
VGQLLGRELAQLVVDQGKQLLGGVWLALIEGRQDTRDLAHQVENNRRGEDPQSSGASARQYDPGTQFFFAWIEGTEVGEEGLRGLTLLKTS